MNMKYRAFMVVILCLSTSLHMLFLSHFGNLVFGCFCWRIYENFHFVLPVLPCKWKTSYRKSRNLLLYFRNFIDQNEKQKMEWKDHKLTNSMSRRWTKTLETNHSIGCSQQLRDHVGKRTQWSHRSWVQL